MAAWSSRIAFIYALIRPTFLMQFLVCSSYLAKRVISNTVYSTHQQRPIASSLCLELVHRAAMSRSLKPTRSWWSCWNMRCSRLRCYFIRFRLFKSLPGERHKRMNSRRKLKARQNKEYSKRSKAGFTGKPEWLTTDSRADNFFYKRFEDAPIK